MRSLCLSVICAIPVVLAACSEAPHPDPRTEVPLVRALAVQKAGTTARTFTGTVAARVQSDLGFRVSGKVTERLVNAGQTVKRGQPLMRIDPVDLTLTAHAQQEAVVAARARAHQAAEDEARYRDLQGTGAISASAYDQIKAAADAARAQRKAAEAQAQLARNATRYAELTADADGIVMETLVEPGQVVAAGQSVVRLAHSGSREAVIQLPETFRPTLGSSGQAALFGHEQDTAPTSLRQLSGTADRLTRTFEARYVLQGALADAPLGATVTVQLSATTAPSAGTLEVPMGALFDPGNGPGVWVVQGTPPKVRWRPVTIEQLEGDGARVTGSLKQGELIVALGAHLLHEGVEVRLADRSADKAAATETGGRGE